MRDLISPPTPSGFRYFQLFRFSYDPFNFLKEAYQECGDIFMLNLPVLGKIVCVACPQIVREISSQSDEIYSAGQFHRMITGSLLGKDSTFTADGESHKERQKLVFKHFNNRNIFHHISMIRSVLMSKLEAHLNRGSVNLCNLFDRTSLEVVGRVLWGRAIDDGNLNHLLDEFHQFSAIALRSVLCQIPKLQCDLGAWSPWGRIMRKKHNTHRLYYQEIQRLRTEGYDTASVIGHLFEDGLSNEAMIEEIFTLLFGGHETTSAMMAWTIYQVAAHPEVKTCLLNEINSVLGKRPIEPKDLPEMPIARAIVEESLRISPAGPFSGGRIAQQDVRSNGYFIKAGTPMLFCPFTIGQREDVWQNASRFDLSRFMCKGDHSLSNQVVFGHGNRVCIGKKLAQLEIIVILTSLFQEVDLEFLSLAGKPERRGLAWVPTQGLRTRIIRRN